MAASFKARPLESGSIFNRLTVLDFIWKTRPSGIRYRFYRCRCECGNETFVNSADLKRGQTKSCGCLNQELRRNRKKHSGNVAINSQIDSYRRSAIKRNLEWSLNRDLAVSLFLSNCHYCGSKPSRLAKTHGPDTALVNGIDRVDSSKGYRQDNCVSCCKVCNYAKSDMSSEDWEAWLVNLVQFRLGQSK